MHTYICTNNTHTDADACARYRYSGCGGHVSCILCLMSCVLCFVSGRSRLQFNGTRTQVWALLPAFSPPKNAKLKSKPAELLPSGFVRQMPDEQSLVFQPVSPSVCTASFYIKGWGGIGFGVFRDIAGEWVSICLAFFALQKHYANEQRLTKKKLLNLLLGAPIQRKAGDLYFKVETDEGFFHLLTVKTRFLFSHRFRFSSNTRPERTSVGQQSS